MWPLRGQKQFIPNLCRNLPGKSWKRFSFWYSLFYSAFSAWIDRQVCAKLCVTLPKSADRSARKKIRFVWKFMDLAERGEALFSLDFLVLLYRRKKNRHFKYDAIFWHVQHHKHGNGCASCKASTLLKMHRMKRRKWGWSYIPRLKPGASLISGFSGSA